MNTPKRISGFLAPAVIVVAALAAFVNGVQAPFLFDDIPSIEENPTIRELSWQALFPPNGWGLTVSGRPVLNATLALNYAISGLDVWSYHVLNVIIHACAGLVLYGIVKRTLTERGAGTAGGGGWGFRVEPWLIALTVATLWAVHPLQVESVTYVIQRAESLMGLFFLLTLYCFIRATGPTHSRRWMAASFLACLFAAGTKEVAVMAPVMVFLYDRTFVAGTFRGAWAQRRWWHLALASTWLVLALLVMATGGNRGGTMGFAAGISPTGLLLTQFEALSRYLWLSVWPHPLVFDYGRLSAEFGVALLRWATPVVLLAAGTLLALWRWPVVGFVGAWFFGILAPTTLIPGMIQMIVEHRMYLPLAGVVALGVALAARWFTPRVFGGVFVVLALAAAALTIDRNALYCDEEALWLDTLAKRPLNARAHNNLGRLRSLAGRFEEAIPLHRESLRLDPSLAQTHFNLGLALAGAGRLEEALDPFQRAIQILPYYFQAHLNLGNALTKLGRPGEALQHYTVAMQFDPLPAEEYFRRGVALAQLGRWREALDDYATAGRLEPNHPELESNRGVALLQLGERAAALEHLERAYRLKPESNEVRFNLALAYAANGRHAEATKQYVDIISRDPTHVDAHVNLGILLVAGGDKARGMQHLETAVRAKPDRPDVHTNYAVALSQAGRLVEAVAEHEAALRLRPDAQAHYNLGFALLDVARYSEARQHFQEALRQKPDFEAAAELLRKLPQ